MTAIRGLVWQDFETRPVRNRQVQFTGLQPGGNGYALLRWLDDRGISAVVDRDNGKDILLHAQEREEARLRPGGWLVIGTEDEVYPIKDSVHDAKYRPVQR